MLYGIFSFSQTGSPFARRRMFCDAKVKRKIGFFQLSRDPILNEVTDYNIHWLLLFCSNRVKKVYRVNALWNSSLEGLKLA